MRREITETQRSELVVEALRTGQILDISERELTGNAKWLVVDRGEREELRVTLRFCPEQLQGWRCHQLH